MDNNLELAKTSSCTQTLNKLASSSCATVRRAVARNINTLSNTLEQLANDPVLNVSFMATKHPRCNTIREFSDTSNPCVCCEKDERYMVCIDCPNKEEYYK